MDFENALLGVHAIATLMMAGLIWFVQIVHYPLFARVGKAHFQSYEQEHQKRTGVIVAPLMLIELIVSIVLVVRVAEAVLPFALIGLALVVFLWLWTFLIMMPQHRRLAAAGITPASIERLVATNWPRTIAWSARGVIAVPLFFIVPAA